ncbi:hypothetical protein [Paenibacillus sp. HB172176]|uniref:hypothetical protein n=1 Tax=Paenibacillus sp. HB172176 TaxID=2493690 RepID=UPI00143B5BB4|nr:hypothetical protein [Paenibacillus sp. HB172176]
MSEKEYRRTKLGIQGPVLAWQDPWAGDASDRLMRTGTGLIYPSQDASPDASTFIGAMKELGTEFYVHHMMPGLDGQSDMIRDMAEHDMDVCLGNEYGNINGPWVKGTNRYDVPDDVILEAARSGKLIGLLYDEPEHLQINAGQYRKDGWYPHWGETDGLTLAEAGDKVGASISLRVKHVRELLQKNGFEGMAAPLISEHVFPVMFHVKARSGMIPCPKIMKESFQSLQLATALGAAKQYGRSMWICADLWGPDIGQWFTRISGFPGHSPEEFESALRMGYLMAPTHLFAENIDALLHFNHSRFEKTVFGEVWSQFVNEFVPRHPLNWSHADAEADIVLIHADDSNFGQNANLFGNREPGSEQSSSVFRAWHLLSHGTIPAHGSCMHIPGYRFPRTDLYRLVPPEQFPLVNGSTELSQTAVHPLFYPIHNVLVFDEHVEEEMLGTPRLIVAAGTRLSSVTLTAIRSQAERGATVIVAEWLVPKRLRESCKLGQGRWIVVDDFLGEEAREGASIHLGSADCWMQRFGNNEVRFYKDNEAGTRMRFEIHRNKS